MCGDGNPLSHGHTYTFMPHMREHYRRNITLNMPLDKKTCTAKERNEQHSIMKLLNAKGNLFLQSRPNLKS